MSELGTRMTALADALAARQPERIVTRDYLDRAVRKDEDLEKGVYTLLSMGERGFTNVPKYNAMDAKHRVIIVADIKVAEQATGSDLEEAEFLMIDEVKDLCRNLPAGLCVFDLESWQQSGQLERPYGWVSFSLEYKP